MYGSKQCGRAFNYGSDRWCDCVPAEADDYCKFTPYRSYATYLFKAESSATVSRSNKSFPAPNHLRLCRNSPILLIVQHARQRADSAQQHRYGAVLPRHFFMLICAILKCCRHPILITQTTTITRTTTSNTESMQLGRYSLDNGFSSFAVVLRILGLLLQLKSCFLFPLIRCFLFPFFFACEYQTRARYYR